jgi:trigger factor
VGLRIREQEERTVMAEKKNSKYEGMSASKAKRERIKDEREKAKRDEIKNIAIVVLIIALVVAFFASFYIRDWYKEKNRTVATTDYSGMLNEDGTISDVNVADYVKTFDVNGVKIAKADVEFTDEQVEEDIQNQLENFKELNTDKSLAVKDGDDVSIDYTGTMDGVEFEGDSAQDYKLTIGSGSFIDDFEQQLIGTHPGDKVTVNVTFPDPYENNPDYAGKEASFAVTVKGIYELGQFNDEFVKKNLSDHAQTVDEYKQYLKDSNYESNLESAIDQYITDNSSAENYPKDYLKHLKSLQMTLDENEYNYMAQMYNAYGMSFEYSSVMAYKGAKDQDEYEKLLQEAAEKACVQKMAIQDLAAQAGITVSDEDYDKFVSENEMTDETVEQYGKPYIIQQYILPDKVKEYIKEHVTVE